MYFLLHEIGYKTNMLITVRFSAAYLA